MCLAHGKGSIMSASLLIIIGVLLQMALTHDYPIINDLDKEAKRKPFSKGTL